MSLNATCPLSFHKIFPFAISVKEVLCRKRRAGRPDLDRHDRADQGGEHLPAGQKHPPGDLCLQVYTKRAAHAFPPEAQERARAVAVRYA